MKEQNYQLGDVITSEFIKTKATIISIEEYMVKVKFNCNGKVKGFLKYCFDTQTIRIHTRRVTNVVQ